ncbi:protein transport protein Sec24-like At3g07100 [Amborella trichopoda]|uniref:Protein transport protein Sec24-like At3g07100 n=1 Tax=Amborella trichopoda TaxID=13333 RepID=U5DEL0_AMBTC|nr:protein transport protein Sec24-like At3g07100 [Amborella trichopoda]XP_020531725.1 protein transport protein Sec24-like At3g07100 [Amborella trichopoda]ERN19877.1 hypothetical protein AMTR_s00071p00045940 [Amborella trichopoda]|eukprot:XP_006858410.1 protein transport protein Sec24-like At3g07100 [Amborella trichopoda]
MGSEKPRFTSDFHGRPPFPFSPPPISSATPASSEHPLNRAPPPPSFNGIPPQNPQFVSPDSVLNRPPIMAPPPIPTSSATVSQHSFYGNPQPGVFGQSLNRPPPVAPPPLITPSSTGSEPSFHGKAPPPSFNGPSQQNPWFVSPDSGPNRPPFPGRPAMAQAFTPSGPPTMTDQRFQPSIPLRPQSQMPSVPLGPPPQGLSSFMAQRPVNPPPPSFQNPTLQSSGPVSQPSMQAFSGLQASAPVSAPPTFQARPAGFSQPSPVIGSHGLYPRDSATLAQPNQPFIGGPHGYYPGDSVPPSATGRPIGGIQGLAEEFESLTVNSAPGSRDAGLDPKSLPRPLDGVSEPAPLYPQNCDPKFLRLTTAVIPNSQSLLSRWHLPLAAVAHPLAESPDGEEVPIVNFGTSGIVRCRRCRTYVNPYVHFADGGRKWRCNICSLLNDVPSDYFAHLDANGVRADIDQHPELTKGSVEYVAPTEYMVRPPMPPLYFFLIDVSLSAVRSGMLEVAAKTIKSCLDKLPGFPRTQIGFLTFDSSLHFYNMKSSLTQPQMMVVADLEDIFVPLPDDLLVNLSESRGVVDAFLDSLPSMFQDTVNVESAFGPALRGAYMIMQQLGGKLLVFQSTLPSIGVAALKLRGDDPRVYGTDKEHTLRITEDQFYKQMAADLTKYQIAVDIFAFSDKYTDIASLGTLAKYTGGQVYYYPSFHLGIQEEKFRHDLARDLTRETAWEAVMRIRCGKGIRFTTYHGHFMLRTTDLLALPAVDCDKAFAMQFSLEETLLNTQTVYFQVALLYTSSSGERRIRIHTIAVPVVSDLGEMYRHADIGAVTLVLGRLAIEKTLSSKLEDARQFIQLRIVKSLREYRNLYAVQHRVTGRMIFPESLKLLPLYGLALCKSIPLRGGHADASLDERCAAGYNMMVVHVQRLLKLLYPHLIRLDEYLIKGPPNADASGEVSKLLPLSAESLDPSGLYIYDDGFRFVIWFGKVLSADIVNKLLGPEISAFADLSKVKIREQNNEVSRKLMRVLERMRKGDPSFYQHGLLVRQGEQPREGSLLLLNLIEDQIGGTSGYLDWMVQMHRQVHQNV